MGTEDQSWPAKPPRRRDLRRQQSGTTGRPSDTTGRLGGTTGGPDDGTTDRPSGTTGRPDDTTGRPAGRTAPSLASLFSATTASVAPQPADAASGASRYESDPTPTVLVVCTGNICRSPLGGLLLRERLAPLGVRVQSAGTRALVGHRMARESQRIAQELGVPAEDAAAHRARALTDAMAARADLTLTMTVDQRTAVLERAPGALRRVFTAREFAALARSLSGGVPRVPDAAAPPRARLAAAVAAVAAQRGSIPPGDDDVIDPYGHSRAVYEESARQLVPAIDDVAFLVGAVLSPRQ